MEGKGARKVTHESPSTGSLADQSAHGSLEDNLGALGHDVMKPAQAPRNLRYATTVQAEVAAMNETQAKQDGTGMPFPQAEQLPVPSYNSILEGLLAQRDYISAHQAHLLEMEKALEQTLQEAEAATMDLFGMPAALNLVAQRRANMDWHNNRRTTPDTTGPEHSSPNLYWDIGIPVTGSKLPHRSSMNSVAATHGGSFDSDSYDTPVGRGMSSSTDKTSPRVKGSKSSSLRMSAHSLHIETVDLSPHKSNTMALTAIMDEIHTSASKDAASKLAKRLQSRLGARDMTTIITPQKFHKTLRRLGSHKYSVEDLAEMLAAIACHTGFSTLNDTTDATAEVPGVPFADFLKFFLEIESKRQAHEFEDGLFDMMLACREILVSGDANRLVAELTQVNVDDMAQRVQTDHLSTYVEPLMSVIILLNSIAIGFAANYNVDEGGRPDNMWFWIDSCFTLCFLVELVVKVAYRGWPPHASLQEYWWNCIDAFLIALGLVDIFLTLVWESNHASTIFAVIRLVRLARLSRLLRVFRATQLRELSLMVKGLLAGMRTLWWANLLLLFVVYVLGIFATTALGGRQPDRAELDMFRSVPLAMFTIFRCIMGDCMDQDGRPIVYMYYEEHGVFFALFYVAAMVVVVFGVFNLIFAIYIETTLAAARKQHKWDKKESIRVARLARELLKKFALGQALVEQVGCNTVPDMKEFSANMRNSRDAAEMEPGNFKITRELFDLVLKDQEAGFLLDAMDISPDRAGLFDILDADSSGAIEAQELIHGLLQVRGEAKKSDVVANLLAVRAVQSMLRQLETEQQTFRQEMRDQIQLISRGMSPVSQMRGPKHLSVDSFHSKESL